ncbi:hypothetical protein DXG03_001444 [Asterophora parasitica]|uniref:Calcineurin-like phosphoesterase domain-containing protein n=1 Tax=Asterophora parasitica TaxID=117018 RepID=A0A9P7GCI4_9AGAR|nr:hypothetical protein DXG03_001444 [Asterophora parasitica]
MKVSPLSGSWSLSLLAVAIAAPQYGGYYGQLNPHPGKPRVTFRPDGTFKLTVFSDLHFGENPWDSWGPEQDRNSTRLMKTVLADEKPDYVVLNGDLVTGENTFRENSTTLIDEIVAPLNHAKIPFSSTHGNHDNQANITHAEEIQREQKVAPLSYTRAAPNGVGGVDAVPALILWFFDSRGGYSAGPNSTSLPDWVDASVANWIESETRVMNAAWGPAEKRGALVFVHIPPHIATGLQINLKSKQNPGLNGTWEPDSLKVQGSVQATTKAANSGKDDAFWKSVTQNIKNLHAVISGHVSPTCAKFEAPSAVLELGSLHNRVISHIDRLVANPELLVEPNASWKEATLDGNMWERLGYARTAWLRFMLEFADDAPLAKATPEQIERAWMESTNDLPETRQFLRKITGTQDASGKNRQEKIQLAKYRQEVAEKKMEKSRVRKAKVDAAADALAKVKPLLTITELEDACSLPRGSAGYVTVADLDLQLNWHVKYGAVTAQTSKKSAQP